MKHSFEHRLQVFGFCLFVCFFVLFYFHLLFEHSLMSALQEMQSAIGRTTHERDRVLADMERIEQV